jgi:DNA-binding GntR family transcriptional regulator
MKNSDSISLDNFQVNRKHLVTPQIYDLLREAIVLLRFLPGQQIKEKVIAKKLAVSRTPIREALLRLEEDGLVEIFPQKGTYISKISIEAVYESQFIRETIECATVKYVVNNGTDELFEKIYKINEEYRNSLKIKDQILFFRLDENFHRTIANFCYKRRLWGVINFVKSDMDRVRLLSLKVPQRPFEVIKEHEKIYDYIINRDESGATKAIQYHLNYIFKEIENVQKNYPDFTTK